MHFISPVLKAIAGVTVLLLLVGTIGWQARHLWIPTMANHWLNGFQIVGLEGVSLAPGDSGINATIDHLRLHGDATEIELRGIEVTHVTALLRSVLFDNGEILPSADLTLENIRIVSPKVPHNPPQAAETETGAGAAPPIETQAPSGDKPTTIREPAAFNISSFLQTLRNLPIRQLTVKRLSWPGQIKGDLAIQVINDKENITGKVESTRCKHCQLKLDLQNQTSEARLKLRFDQSQDTISSMEATLKHPHATRQPAADTSPWVLSSQLKLDTAKLAAFLQSIGFNTNKTTTSANGNWQSVLDGAEGNIQLQFTGELPAKLASLKEINSVSVELSTEGLLLTIPDSVAGISLTSSVNSTQPVQLNITSLSPLKVQEIVGELAVEMTLSNELANNTDSTKASNPILSGTITLTTEQQKPRVKFTGNANLTEASPLLSASKWQQWFTSYKLSNIHGNSNFSGEFYLPSQDSMPEKKHLADTLSLAIHPVGKLQLELELPAEKNPLDALGWKKIKTSVITDRPLTISASKWPGPLTLKMRALSIDASESRDPKSHPNLTGQIKELSCEDLLRVRCRVQSSLNLSSLTVDNTTTLIELSSDFTADIARLPDKEAIQVTLSSTTISATQLSSEDIVISNPEAFAQDATCLISDTAMSCSSKQIATNVAPFNLPDLSINGVLFIEDIQIENRWDAPTPLTASAHFRSDSLSVSALKQFDGRIAVQGQFEVKAGMITGKSEISAGHVRMESEWQHELANNRGLINLTLPDTSFTEQNSLGKAVRGLPADIVGGNLSAKLKLYWPQGNLDWVKLNLREAALKYNDSFAVGITASPELIERDGMWLTKASTPVSIQAVDTGIAINNLHFDLTISQMGDVTLKDFSGELLEGALTTNALHWNLRGKERQSEVRFTGISLRALTREMNAENFVASGLLDATIPLTTDSQGITVQGGTLQSRPPGGRLRYYGAFSPAMLGSNPQLKLLAGALEDYNYRDIRGTVTYPLNGDLKLKLKLTGRSTAIDANRDLIINLNLENNVPSMLRSLQASRDLTDILEKQVQ
ncbi:YdbH domain-containing protein [Microbulbifer bruguierae]|uniref:YdbH domain-containing protein n=1 Tax=Microbulbifer bruguierae TaxID=3029061 RepID=A0ABY8NF99_9GAMM|nr:YdbH domain-containing protein [Microbulbifer bruguierae]WGL17610.1 YdbH domain-containing protein [Microbulbifer bruguierae]